MNERRLSKPLYESLPWMYAGGGVLALGLSYLTGSRLVSVLAGVAGITGVVGGSVLLLRRRDYRALRSQYGAVEWPPEEPPGRSD